MKEYRFMDNIINKLNRIIIISGHYGSGKTNFSINLALDMANSGKKVTLVDLDVVNPYFRSSDYKDILQQNEIYVISPKYAGTNLDTPALSAEIESVFDDNSYVVFDVGGDDAGAFALGRYASKIKKESYSFIYLVNKYRNLINTPQQATEILYEIISACGLEPSYVVNNSHLQSETTSTTIINAFEYGKQIAELLNIPLLCTTSPDFLKDEYTLDKYDLYYIKQIVKPPFGR